MQPWWEEETSKTHTKIILNLELWIVVYKWEQIFNLKRKYKMCCWKTLKWQSLYSAVGLSPC